MSVLFSKLLFACFSLSRNWMEIKAPNEFSGFLKAEMEDWAAVFHCWHFTSHHDGFRQLIHFFYGQISSFIKKKKEVRGYNFDVFSICYKTLHSALLLFLAVEEWVLWEIFGLTTDLGLQIKLIIMQFSPVKVMSSTKPSE